MSTSRKKFVTKEENKILLEKIKSEVPILDYGVRLGLTPVKAGRYVSFKEHDSVRVDPETNRFHRNSTGLKAGSIVDFVMEFEGVSLHQALSKLTDMVGGVKTDAEYRPAEKKADSKKEKPFCLPERDNKVNHVYAYLIHTRGIDKAIVSEQIVKGRLYQDKHRNCVFVGRDKRGEPVFSCKRGTNTYKKFVADVEGSDYRTCFYLDHGADMLIVNESPIDTLSVMTIKKLSGEDYHTYDYLALAGVGKIDSLYYHLEQNKKIKKVILYLDNDKAGLETTSEAVKKLQQDFPHIHAGVCFPHMQDYNDELLKKREEMSLEGVERGLL